MNSFEIQKIISAILITILVVFGIGKISDIIFDKDLENNVPKKCLMDAHNLLILHGRRVCKSQKPLCESCFVQKNCLFNKNI